MMHILSELPFSPDDDMPRGRYSGEPGMIEHAGLGWGNHILIVSFLCVDALIAYCFLAFFHLVPWWA